VTEEELRALQDIFGDDAMDADRKLMRLLACGGIVLVSAIFLVMIFL
jgi:hypothetical protein